MAIDIEPASAVAGERLEAFFARVPEGDRTFFREDVLAPGVIERWAHSPDGRFVAVDGSEVVGYLAVIQGVGWSSHVGELRVVVDPGRRRQGIGQALARRGLLHGLELSLSKLIVEVVADQESTLAMFSALGFQPEALLRDHVRDGRGQLRDLITMAHLVDDNWGAIHGAGIDEVVG
ncbi:MAG: GNAT family N-acetyltransferase [Acidimicrobiales bacterium]